MWRGCRAHLLPGRLRVWLPGLLRRPERCAAAVARVGRLAGVRSVAANPVTGSLLVCYDGRSLCADNVGDALGLPSDRPAPDRAPRRCTAAQRQALLMGGALGAVLVKRFLFGPSALASSMLTWDLAGLVTVASAYPLVRHGVGRRLPGADALLAGAGMAAALVRENVPGLLVLFTRSLHQLISSRPYGLFRGNVGPAPGDGTGTRAAVAAGASQWGTIGLTAGLAAAAASGNWRQGLATLVAGAPAASAFAATLPRALAVGRGDTARALAARTARQNRWLAAILHAAGLTLAASGSLTPNGASLWNNLTSLAVMGNATRVLRAV